MTTNFIPEPTHDLAKLNYSVLVEAKNNGYQATVWGLPDCQVFAKTREEALRNLHALMNSRLQNVEIVTQEIEPSTPEHPWMKFAGKYQNDPQFDDMLADIAAYRRELDAKMAECDRQFDAEEKNK